MTTTEQPQDFGTWVAGMAATAREEGGVVDSIDQAIPAIAGTFALYPMENGGLVFVADVKEGPMAGTHRHIMPPAMIRAVAAFGQGGGKLGALKALIGRG